MRFASTWVDGRRLRFEPVLQQPRLRVILTGPTSEALGSVIGLDTSEPGIRVSAPLHVEWATAHREAIIGRAVLVWAAITGECES
jgi:hypothetical protein